MTKRSQRMIEIALLVLVAVMLLCVAAREMHLCDACDTTFTHDGAVYVLDMPWDTDLALRLAAHLRADTTNAGYYVAVMFDRVQTR